MNTKSNDILLKKFFTALDELREHKILINNKDFTGQIGEWLVEMIYDGKRSTNGIEKGWDVKVKNENIQVKTHAKADTNKSRFSAIKNDYENVQIDTLIIIVFSPNYKLKEFYKIPWKIAEKFMKITGGKSPRNEINWSKVKNYKIKIEELPNQEIIKLFV